MERVIPVLVAACLLLAGCGSESAPVENQASQQAAKDAAAGWSPEQIEAMKKTHSSNDPTGAAPAVPGARPSNDGPAGGK